MSETALDFQKIHDEFRSKIRSYLARLVGEYEAEDLTQDVFIKVSRALQTFRGESQLSTWIYRIATNAALDKLRDPSLKRVVQNGLADSSDTDEIKAEDKNIWTGEAALSPEQQLFRRERFECYCDRIQTLPSNYRTIMELSELEELAANEIADLLGLSLEVVKIRLHRGRKKLLQELKSHCKAEDWL